MSEINFPGIEFTSKISYVSENSAYNESYSAIVQENDDMTETSDSGFTETNQSRTSEGSQCDTKSGNSSPNSNSMEENNSLIACENSENLIMDAVGSEQEDVNGESSMINDDDTSSSSSSEESDEDYDESERNGHGKSSVFSWVRHQMQKGANPREIIQVLLHNFHIPENMSESMLWRIISLAVTPQRERLNHVKSLDDAVQHIKQAKNIIILTGAGVSVSCGIPDFRSRDGVYSRLSREYPNLPDPQAMFDIKYFFQDPRPFYKFAREIFPGQFKPSPSHRFIKKMEERGVLLRNYTQNIDTLERIAGISRLIECHGSFATASCTRCKFRINGDAIREHILQQRIPVCFLCNPHQSSQLEVSVALNPTTESPEEQEQLRNLVTKGIFKPDIVFFGEELPDDFHDSIDTDRHKCDLLIVIGSSLKVKPVAMIPNLVPEHIPQILINREPLPHMNFDVNLYGDSDVIISHLFKLIDENDTDEELCWFEKPLEEVTVEIPVKSASPTENVTATKITTTTTTTTTIPPKAIETCPTEKIVIEEKKVAEEKKEEEKVAVKEDSAEILVELLEESKIKKAPENQTSSHAQSLSHLLPPHSYAQISPRCYLFSGAEVTADNMDDDGNSDANSDESDEEEEDEIENNEFSDEEELEEAPEEAISAVNEIIVPDIDNCQVMSCEIPVPEISPAPSTNSVSSPARSQLECGDRETVETIDANIHNDDNDLEPAPLKKPRLDTEESIF